MKKILIILVVILLGIIGSMFHQMETVNTKWKRAEANVKAYSKELSASKDKNVALQLTCSQLSYFSDSTLRALDETRKELNIKEKNLKALQAIKSTFTKNDTILITQVDTLFRDPTLAIDTLIGDYWYNVKLGFKYPSTVAVQPYFRSEKHVVVSSKKETVNPPKKFFLFRLFQKKHYVLNINVIEKNPYVGNESSKYVEVIK